MNETNAYKVPAREHKGRVLTTNDRATYAHQFQEKLK